MGRFRILSYNVHACIGIDKLHAPDRVAHVIAACKPDIVALQEIDVGRARSGGIDQAHTLAQLLGMKARFNPSTQNGAGQKEWGARKAKPSFPGRMPTLRIDHVWLRGRAHIENVEVVRTPLSRVASDHLPIVVDIDIASTEARHHGGHTRRAR